MPTELRTIKTASGFSVQGAFASVSDTHAGLVIIHEWWGLNDEMKLLAEHYAEQGFTTVAVDLFNGATADNDKDAFALMQSLDPQYAQETLQAWLEWLRLEQGCGKVGTLGFCLGGAWSLNVSLTTPVDATVIYYGQVSQASEQVSSLAGPVLGHFGQKDPIVPVSSVLMFQEKLESDARPGEIYIYDADHAFARTHGPNYEPLSANLAAQRTLGFLARHLQQTAAE